MNMQLVVFKIDCAEYALPIERVKEIINYVPVTRLPGTPTYLEGIINVRGKIVPVVNFALKMELSSEQASKQIVIVESQEKTVGLTVDTVTEVVHAADNQLTRLDSANVETETPSTVCMIQNRIIILLDLEKILSGAPSANLN